MNIAGIPDFELDNSPLPILESPNFDEIQQSVISHQKGSLLVTGGAGSGKTTLLAESAIGQIKNGLDSDKILFFCFSRQQARSMRKYLARRLAGYSIPRVATFHSFTHSVMQSAFNQGLVIENYSFTPLRLLSGPEQEVMIQELIKGSIEDKSINWPESLLGALNTKGFVRQVRNLFARMRALGMDPEQLIDIGNRYEIENWVCLGKFAEMYLDTLDASQTIDYGELVHRVNLLINRLKSLDQLNINYSHFYVDEYQDIDPAQVNLLKSLVKGNKFLLATGDSAQSIYQFRGSDFEALNRFKIDFENSKIINLEKNYRQKSEIINSCYTYDSLGAQNFHIANQIRRYKQDNPNLKWADILIIVRNSSSVNSLLRALNTYSIPVSVQADDLPLAKEPAARVLLDCLNIAGQLAAGNKNPTTPEVIRDLLQGPLISANPKELRETARLLRKKAKDSGEQLFSSDQSIYNAVIDPRILLDIDSNISQGIRRLGSILFTARDLIAEKTRVEVVLWNVWMSEISEKNKKIFDVIDIKYQWSTHLQETALKSGLEGRKADKDLDSILTLFDAASRDDERTLGTRGVLNFLSELGMQAFQAETLAQKPVEDDRIQIVTAHKAKGLEANFVIIPNLQVDQWPSVKARNNLLEVERLGYETVVRAPSKQEILQEEFRLFEVAKKRATQKLLVTAIKSDFVDNGEPSILFNQFGLQEIEHISGYPQRALSLNSLVAELRKISSDSDKSEEFKKAVAKRLQLLAESKDAFGRKINPNAEPDNWWALNAANPSQEQIAPENRAVKLSGSGLATLRDCGLKWFLEKKAGANEIRQNSASIGSIVHALAQGLTKKKIPANKEALVEKLDEIWPQLNYEAKWLAEKEYRAVLEIIDNLLHWHLQRNTENIIGAEVYFSTEIEIENEKVALSGYIDRVEIDSDNNLIQIIDFKTAKTELTKEDALHDPQLGVYQLAVEKNALKTEQEITAINSKANLVYLRNMQKNGVKELASASLEENGILDLLKTALKVIREEEFKPTPNPTCRTCKFTRMCPAQAEGRSVIN